MATEFATEIAERLNGPFNLRLFLQPAMALLFALRDGRADAKSGTAPYLWTILFQADQRREKIASAWVSVGMIMLIAFILDSAFQFATGNGINLKQAGIMSILLCAAPYTMMRGPAARFFRNRRQPPVSNKPGGKNEM